MFKNRFNIVLLIFSACFFAMPFAHGQNAPPQVSNVVAVADTVNRIVTITYDVADAENDDLQIDFRVSADSGSTYLFPADSVEGDIGFPVQPGNQKQIAWHYDPGLVKLSGQSLHSFRAKVIADDLHSIEIADIVNQVDIDRMRFGLEAIDGVRHFSAGPDLWNATKTYIEEKFMANGLHARRQDFVHNNVPGTNVIGRLPGHTAEEFTYIIDGHFDTVSTTPGADDNGTGTIGMIEAMQILSKYNFAKTIVFIGFDLEEVGLRGSQSYVRDAIPAWQQTEGVFNFEMIGYTCDQPGCDDFSPQGNYIHNIADPQSTALRQAFDAARAAYVPALPVISTLATPDNPNFRRSDHARFWDAGIPAVFLTDGANFRNPHYHRQSDTIATLNFDFMSNVVKTTIATVAELAEIKNSGSGVSNYFDLNITSFDPDLSNQPRTFALKQNFPNPFNPSTRIEFSLETGADIDLSIYNMTGEQIRMLVSSRRSAGTHFVNWNGRDASGQQVASGIYIYRISNGSQLLAKKMILLR